MCGKCFRCKGSNFSTYGMMIAETLKMWWYVTDTHTEGGFKFSLHLFQMAVSFVTHLCKPIPAGSDVIWLFLRSSHSRLGRLMNNESGMLDIWFPSRYKYCGWCSQQLELADHTEEQTVLRYTNVSLKLYWVLDENIYSRCWRVDICTAQTDL